jgi:hypothetical protein
MHAEMGPLMGASFDAASRFARRARAQLSDARTWLVAWQAKPPAGRTELLTLATDRPGAFAATGS